jgi:hypothetical protein
MFEEATQMACSDVDGTFEEGILLFDDSETVEMDPVLHLTPPNANGEFEGKFGATGEVNFKGTCTKENGQSKITFTRKHPGGGITEYRGKIFQTPKKVCIRGRFERTPGGLAIVPQKGDWETEKPT